MRQLEVQRSVLRYFGGKWKIAEWVLSHFPSHSVYVEPFGGSASVLMRKPPCDLEVYNDASDEIVNVFRVLQNKETSAELQRLVRLTPYSRTEYNRSYEVTKDPVERARRTIIRAFVGFGSNGANRINQKTGFRSRLDFRSDDYADAIPTFTERLKHVIIENMDALELMPLHDSPDALHFVDPPYVHGTRGKGWTTKDRYEHELTDEQHEQLISVLWKLKGAVILCGYENPIYDQLGWDKRRQLTHADKGGERTEVIWLNPACENAQSQQTLFAESPKEVSKDD